MEPSPALKKELLRWLSDATSDNPSEQIKTVGLCVYVDKKVYEELHEIFRHLCFSGVHDSMLFPFSRPGEYSDAARERTQHLNPRRLAWVRSVLDVT